jgi:hypothetical protein
MDQIGTDQHPDVAAEVGQRAGQAAAVFATLGEAAARLAAEERRRQLLLQQQREEAAEQQAEDARELRARADKLAEHAARQRAAHDRRIIAQVVDPDWLANAPLYDLAVAWRTARVREHQFPEARGAAEAVEERLREMYPRPMDLYDEAVRNGTSRAEAMRMAAAEMARTPVMRPHPGGTRAGALGPPDEAPVGDEAFAAAVADEQIRLATGVDAGEYLAELRRLGPGGEAAAQALREALAARAGRENAQGRADAATPDNLATPGVDEHATVGMPRNIADMGAASRDSATAASTGAPGTRTAAQLAGEWYPEGINHPAAMPAHVAGKRPANAAPTQAPARTAGRAR